MKTITPSRSSVLFVRGLRPEAKRAFKALCARGGVSMSSAVAAMLDEAVREGRHFRIASKEKP